MILAFDTAAGHCAAGVFARGAVQAAAVEPMARGQAERLMGLCAEVMAASELSFADLQAIGVGVGPGNFTGIRIAVSAARGLALGLGVPAIPVTAFELMRENADQPPPAHELVAVQAPRGAAYVQPFQAGLPQGPAELIDPSAPPAHLRHSGLLVCGDTAAELASALGGQVRAQGPMDTAQRLACITQRKFQQGRDMGASPKPLYLRPADAAPARDAPPVILP